MPGILLKDALNRDNNNLDIFRIIAATAVIVGHSYAISPLPGAQDLMERFLEFTYSGAYAVKIFFFLSGLVVTNSLLEKKNWFHFLVMRFFRLVPALFVTLLFSVLILGPLLTTIPLSSYFYSSETYLYIIKNLIFKTTFELPGVFTENPYSDVVNGSLWTLRWEVLCYLVLLAIFLLGAFKRRIFFIGFFLLLTVEVLLPERVIFKILTNDPEVFYTPWCFAFGAVLISYKDEVYISGKNFLVAVLICLLLKDTVLFEITFYLATFLGILWISTLRFVRALKPRSDISYGVYLYAFPIQQTIVYFLGVQFGILPHILLATAVTFMFGWVSWHVIEKPSMKFARNIQDAKFRSKLFSLKLQN